MPKTYYFAGHETLSNRGCEALLRGITQIVHQADAQAEFLAPTFDLQTDAAQWSDAAQQGVRFVDAYRLPPYAKVWARVHARWPAVRRAWMPMPSLPAKVADKVAAADAGIMTGGDVLSMEYGVPSLIKYMGQAQALMSQGKPMHLWAASVGPFSAAPDLERRMAAHLARYASLSVRESASLAYLHGLGLTQTVLVADPAFVMQPEAWNVDKVLPADRGEGVLGFNISPLIRKLLGQAQGQGGDMEVAVLDFLHAVLERTRLSLMLIPHVDSIDGGSGNSDFVYMQSLLSRGQWPQDRLSLAPRSMSAAQTKFLISQCRYFIGARTHATIGAWSTGVPTCSLGYSIKARGLNRDLFGDERHVLDTKKLTGPSLWAAFERLQADEQSLRSLLATRMPEWRARAHLAARPLSGA